MAGNPARLRSCVNPTCEAWLGQEKWHLAKMQVFVVSDREETTSALLKLDIECGM